MDDSHDFIGHYRYILDLIMTSLYINWLMFYGKLINPYIKFNLESIIFECFWINLFVKLCTCI